MKPLTIAVTGATGFLGEHTVRRFNGLGHNVRVLMRSGNTLDAGPRPVTVIPGDLNDKTALAKLADGADFIFHLAGAIKAPNRNAFMRANRDGTELMVTAWKKYSPEAGFVLTSSLAARHPELSHYAASKAAAEAVVQGTKAVVFRPTAIYGPKDRETLRLFKATRWPLQVSLNTTDARLTFIHIFDVVDALVAVIQHPENLEHKVFELCDGNYDGYSWSETITSAADSWKRKARIVRLPAWVLRLGGRFGDLQAHFGNAPMLTSEKCNEILFKNWSIAPSETLPSHIWSPRIGIEEGFRQTFDWYRNAGWL